mmetsp:Transcript_77121/g.231365  ORF Transcript_77121/g.231365 Transcript_77121/m.231365 type:complete len:110 (+) Transcript_77121:81-410(+)
MGGLRIARRCGHGASLGMRPGRHSLTFSAFTTIDAPEFITSLSATLFSEKYSSWPFDRIGTVFQPASPPKRLANQLNRFAFTPMSRYPSRDEVRTFTVPPISENSMSSM